jgi:hypothetical protein
MRGSRATWRARILVIALSSMLLLPGVARRTAHAATTSLSHPVVALDATNRLEVFASAGTGEVFRKYQWSGSPTGWSAWVNLGKPPTSDMVTTPVAVERNNNGRLEIFRIEAGSVYHDYQLGTNPTDSWSGWISEPQWPRGTFSGSPYIAAGHNQDGRLEIFTQLDAGQQVHAYQLGPNGQGGWSQFVQVAPVQPTAFAQAWTVANDSDGPNHTDGRMEVFAWDGLYRHLWLVYQTTPNGGWSNWVDFGGPNGTAGGFPAVARNADGRLEAFVEGTDGALWHRWQNNPGGGWKTNPDWVTLGGSVNSVPAAISNTDGRLEVFMRDASGYIVHRWQSVAAGAWSSSGWQRLGTVNTFADWVSVGRNADGRLEVFAAQLDGKIYHSYQSSNYATGWSPWSQLQP